jgi:hypothetical protein
MTGLVTEPGSALGRRDLGGSKRMWRARYLASDGCFFEGFERAGMFVRPTSPTPKCALAWHAGLSTNYCMDHQASLINAGAPYRILSQDIVS